MKDQFRNVLEGFIERTTGQKAHLEKVIPIGGGCINQASLILLEDGRRYFLKTNSNPMKYLFLCEAAGLKVLCDAAVIRVPQPIGTDADCPVGGTVPFILMEAITEGPRRKGFMAAFGQQFALLHQKTTAPAFGFNHNNYLGSTLQPNPWTTDWCEFWRQSRLGFQLELARKNGYRDETLERLGKKLLDRLDEWLAFPEEPPCLLHGDLWGGNYLSDEQGAAVLIDPAVYYGRREADLAMTYLFGGFDSSFYHAYQEVWPLAEGTSERIEIYKLYHLLNHLNLFGSTYLSGCLAILHRFV
jgi:fructosamine-3-kinase